MPTTFNPDFSRRSQYNEESSTVLVRFGADSPVTEMDLNEMQLVQNKRLRDFIKSIVDNGISNNGEIKFITDEFSLLERYVSYLESNGASIRYSPNADGSDMTETRQPDSQYVGVGYMPNEIVEHENLYTGTKDFSGEWTNKAAWVNNGFNGDFLIKSKSSAWLGLNRTVSVLEGETYTYSANLKATALGITSRSAAIGSARPNDAVISSGTSVMSTQVNVWERCYFTFEINTSGNIRPGFEKNENSGTLEVCGIKLEKGLIATPWTPAPSEWLADKTNYEWNEISEVVSEKGLAGLIIRDEYAFINGYLLYIDNTDFKFKLSDLQDDTKFYLNAYIREVAIEDDMYKFGNLQGDFIPNYINDNRYDQEITRREQIVYEISFERGSHDMSIEIAKYTEDEGFAFTYDVSGAIIDDSEIGFIDASDEETIPKINYSLTDAKMEIEALKDDIQIIESSRPMDREDPDYEHSIVNFYVDKLDESNDGIHFNSILEAIASIPKNLNGNKVYINIKADTYTDELTIEGFYNGQIYLFGSENQAIMNDTVLESTTEFPSITTINTSAEIIIKGLHLKTETSDKLVRADSACLKIINCIITSNDFLLWNKGNIIIADCFVSDAGVLITSIASTDSDSYDLPITGHIFNCSGITCDRIAYLEKGILNIGKTFISPVNDSITKSGAIIIDGTGGDIILEPLQKLRKNLNLYVNATTGNNSNDGSESAPFKTIQHAINNLPKNLNSYTATIVVASGTYSEDVLIMGFTGGYLRINSSTSTIISDSCKVKSFIVRYCASQIIISGFSGTSIDDAPFISTDNTNCRFYYCQVITDTPTKYGFYFANSFGAVSNCRSSGRHTAIQVTNGRVLSDAWNTTNSTNYYYGISAGAGGIITQNGNQPKGNNRDEICDTGGSIFQQNGTQISGLITSGLSCTWGTISGGYIRHGNVNGVAMVTVQLRVTVTSNLSADVEYSISGFPVVIGSLATVAVACSYMSVTRSCHMEVAGNIKFKPSQLISSGGGNVLLFNFTYMTNS